MPTVLITGSSGLVGSACVRHFSSLGWEVHGIDNNTRKDFFGPDGDTDPTRVKVLKDCPGVTLHTASILDWSLIKHRLLRAIKPDLVIHAAAQPSHDYAAAHPFEDFETNARGTLNLLEAVRHHAPQAVFVFMSTNKVYGDMPNIYPLDELPTRFEYHTHPTQGGVGEWLSIDTSLHSLFGCSKLAADIYTQEYGRNFGMKTVCFRCGCLTGGAHAGAEQHGFLSYLVRCCREGRKYKVFGFRGKQIRDQLHGTDVARACEEFWKNPGCGEVFNLGGGRQNSISVLEAIAETERRLDRKLDWEYVDEPRKGDHICYYTDNSKFKSHYPNWDVRISLSEILDELCQVTG